MDGSDEEVFPASQIPKAAGSRDQAGSENRRVWTAQRERGIGILRNRYRKTVSEGNEGDKQNQKESFFFFSFSDLRNWMEYKENEASL